ncbi:MAG TPA: aminotransferase class I/II-fold pyridoxal phosphate-dependent enzyme [Clostridiales bacterium]|nr:aminotransferase class I/II-fold pyridoxal phosphate-dependent enzyme [Clostridiales bacterium]
MNYEMHKETPIYTELEKYSKEHIIHFDVPGHKKNTSSPLAEAFGERIALLDANSTKALDMLSNPTGVIKKAEELMADAYNADYAFMLVNGSTFGIISMIMSACDPKDKIIMPRNIHKSAVSGIILSGAVPVFIDPEIDIEYGITNGITYDSVKKAIKYNPDTKAVFIINPTYFGTVSDLRAIIRLCHRHNIAVLVDEAHGSHFPFHPDFPDGAMALGADMSTVSIHKTGGSLTQSSALLLNERIIKKEKVRTIVNLMQTTSASYILLTSLDVARRHLVLNGREIFGKLLSLCEKAKTEISKMPGLNVITRDEYVNGKEIYDYDETKIVVRVNDLGLTGFEVYDLFKNEYSIQLELAETYAVLAVTGPGDNEESINYLVDAFRDLSLKYYGKRQPLKIPLMDYFIRPKTVILPREAFYSRKRSVPISEAMGEISGESVMIYPPGIPLVIPGERITDKVIEHYNFYIKQDCVIMNDDGNPDFIKVLGE